MWKTPTFLSASSVRASFGTFFPLLLMFLGQPLWKEDGCSLKTSGSFHNGPGMTARMPKSFLSLCWISNCRDMNRESQHNFVVFLFFWLPFFITRAKSKQDLPLHSLLLTLTHILFPHISDNHLQSFGTTPSLEKKEKHDDSRNTCFSRRCACAQIMLSVPTKHFTG